MQGIRLSFQDEARLRNLLEQDEAARQEKLNSRDKSQDIGSIESLRDYVQRTHCERRQRWKLKDLV